MPELPEVETVRRQLEEQILGKKIESVSKTRLSLRKPFLCSSAMVKGKKITGFSRWGKRLFIHIGKSEVLDVSLGMTGSFRVESLKDFKKMKHDHIQIRTTDGKNLVYTDPRRFGWVEYKAEPLVLSGWDPLLSSKKDFKKVIELSKNKEVDAYTFLMDQKYIVGLGNIYVQEILFKTGVSPFRKIKDCSDLDFENIRKKTIQTLRSSLNHGGSTILNYKNAEGKSGAFQKKLYVYGKKKGELCSLCKGPIQHIQKARAICFCPTCQV